MGGDADAVGLAFVTGVLVVVFAALGAATGAEWDIDADVEGAAVAV